MLYRDAYRTAYLGIDTLAPEKVDAMGPWQLAAKRGADVLMATLGLLLLSWLFLLIYVILKCSGEKKVIFSQERIGKGGKPFNIYKFKTFPDDAEADGPQLAAQDDERATKVGRFLRVYHLDELPQLWNVLIGDMSMVGPRPERQFFIDKIMQYDARYRFLYKLRPGVTSDATLHNGYTDTMEKMLKRLDRDLYYLENRTLWMDFKIVLHTALSLISCRKI